MKWKRNCILTDVLPALRKPGYQSAGGYTGRQIVKVDLSENQAVVELDHDVDDEVFKTAVYDAGYDVTHIE